MTNFKIGQRVNVESIKREGDYYCRNVKCTYAIYNGIDNGRIHILTDEKTINYNWNHVTSGFYYPEAYNITPSK
jgi:membrane-bound inhibitor of C-type lysozyme